ncbi:MAG: hypothetical protein C5B58_16485 [Acidobacteria bacterium]|nr:MAG: hypothetical protein C5B58_16485 [Acidobacteriota bacterium]
MAALQAAYSTAGYDDTAGRALHDALRITEAPVSFGVDWYDDERMTQNMHSQALHRVAGDDSDEAAQGRGCRGCHNDQSEYTFSPVPDRSKHSPLSPHSPGKAGNVGNVSTTADRDEHQFWHEATV